jgi:hypothetical protein
MADKPDVAGRGDECPLLAQSGIGLAAAFVVLTKTTHGRSIALIYYGSFDDPQSQPPAGTSVEPQNVSVPFV